MLLDLSSAFDTIDHQIFLNVLQNDFGIIGSVHKWFASYLSGRKQRLIIKGSISYDFHVSCSVSKASCTGPILVMIIIIIIITIIIIKLLLVFLGSLIYSISVLPFTFRFSR